MLCYALSLKALDCIRTIDKRDVAPMCIFVHCMAPLESDHGGRYKETMETKNVQY